MNRRPKILLVEEDKAVSEDLCRRAQDELTVEVEESPEQAVDRMGFEDFDLVVMDSENQSALLTSAAINIFGRLRVPFLLFGRKPAGLNGAPVLARADKDKFVQAVADLLKQQSETAHA